MILPTVTLIVTTRDIDDTSVTVTLIVTTRDIDDTSGCDTNSDNS